jgi:serine-type D-Ala-D-Ala carboxypeptidase/endopeptidase (penicillin-binding protein 4)
MTQKRTRLTSLTVLTVAALACAKPVMANDTVSTTRTNFFNESDGIDIYVPPPENHNNGVCSAFFTPAINSIIGSSSNHWGILVESLEDGRVLYSHNADKYFIPASNTKLFTTAAALQKLDPYGTIRTTSVRNWINITNLKSNNNYAEVLLRFLGGTQAAQAALSEMGIDPHGYRLVDGSGLSRSNVATPRAIVSILKAMHHSQRSALFVSSLPIAGISGTLEDRMRFTRAQGIVHAKTGTLSGVRALSGYMDHPLYGKIAFSIIANNSKQSGKALTKSIDDIVLQLSMLTPCDE